MRRANGFTLVELLVALFALALLAMLSWRGLDGMMRARAHTEARADEVLALQTGLGQWVADLDALVQFPQLAALEWNGRVLRLTRRDTLDAAAGIRVVGWTRREGLWLRWQSGPLVTRGDVEAAWQLADQWSQNPGDALRQQQVAIVPLQDWQIFYFRENAWSNPLSSAVASGTDAQEAAQAAQAAPGARQAGVLPDGVRLVLQLPATYSIGGQLVRDWVRPTVAGDGS